MAYKPEEIADFKEKIVTGISEGKSLKSILENDDTLPSRQTVYEWLNESHQNHDKTFLDNYVRAREDSADLDAEKVQEIAEKTLDGTYKPDAARVALDALKWSSGVKQPKKYGNKIDHTTGGKPIESNKAIQVEIVRTENNAENPQNE